jgi:hypothetical protein
MAVWSAVAATSGAAAAPAARKPKQVLFFTKSSGFEHSVIKAADGQPSHAERVLKALGARSGFEVTHTKDGSVFTPEGIARYDAIVLYTSGDLYRAGTDGQPPLPPGGKDVLIEAVRKGRGVVGIHAATDTFHSAGDRWEASGEATDPFIQMLGGEFIVHGSQQRAKVFCADPKFPGLAACPGSFEMLEEWYSLKNLAPDMRVLMWLGTWTLRNAPSSEIGYRRPPFPVTWARRHGAGRVFCTVLGHREDVWDSAIFQEAVSGGILWAAGAVKADVRSNIRQVTPFYDELPPRDERAAK